MSKFLDGPAAGVSLMLRRAPMFLRAVKNAKGEWDALDQPTDTVAKDETVAVYVRVGEPVSMHVDRVVKGRRVGEWYQVAEYRLYPATVPEEIVRDNNRWRKWTTEKAHA